MRIRNRFKIYVTFIGLIFLIANATYWVFHFFRTYLAPNHKIIHSVNVVGEANIEAVFILIQLFFMMPAIYFLIKQQTDSLKRQSKEPKKC